MVLSEIGGRIKYLRGDESLPSFANKLGVHKNTLARYEKGESQPDVGFVLKLCEMFDSQDVNPNWLILGEGFPPMPSYSEAHEELRERLEPFKNIEKAREVVRKRRLQISPQHLAAYIAGEYLPTDSELLELCTSIAFYDFEAVKSERKPKDEEERDEDKRVHIAPIHHEPFASTGYYCWPGGKLHSFGLEYDDYLYTAKVFNETEEVIEALDVSLNDERKRELLLLLFSIVRLASHDELKVIKEFFDRWEDPHKTFVEP